LIHPKRNRSIQTLIMKKILVYFLILSAFTFCSKTGATNVGEVIDYTLHTDIAAYINHYPIKSYNIAGNTAIAAEDLINYGFDVAWNASEKALYITRNNASEITPKGTVYADTNPVGSKYLEVYYTDIKTYVNGTVVPSYNVGGKTILAIDNLSVFGAVAWVPEVKAIKVWLDHISYKNFEFLPLDEQREYYPNTEITTYVSVTKEPLIDVSYGGGAISYKYQYNPISFEQYKIYMQMQDYIVTQTIGDTGISYNFVKGNSRFAVACDASKSFLWLATEDKGSGAMSYYTGTNFPTYSAVTGKVCSYTIYFEGATQTGFIDGGDGFVYSYDKSSLERYIAFINKIGYDTSNFDYNINSNEMTYYCQKDSLEYRIVISYNYNQLCIIPKK